MKQRIVWRLIPLSTLTVGVALLALAVGVCAFAFNAYVASLQHDSETLIDEAQTTLAGNAAPRNALPAADAIAPRLFRRSLLITFIDSARRVTVFYPVDSARHAKPSIVVRGLDDRSGEPQTRGMLARLVLGSSAISGLHIVRAHIHGLDMYVKDNDAVLVAEIGAYLPIVLGTLVLILTLAYASGTILNRQALRPLVEVTAALERLAVGDFTPQFVFTTNEGELGRLARAFNGAVAQVKSAFEQRDAAYASMRQFVSDAGHQLRTPLTVIRGFIAILADDNMGASEEQHHGLRVMHQQSVLMGSLIDNLILLDRWEHEQVQSDVGPVDVTQLARDIVGALADIYTDRTIRYTIEHERTLYAKIDPRELTYAITNLVDNALKYTRGSIDVSVTPEADSVRLEVADEGPGMHSTVAERVFDRFFRGERRDIEGSGLGLPIAKGAVERAGGTIYLDTAPNAGSRVTITLPRTYL